MWLQNLKSPIWPLTGEFLAPTGRGMGGERVHSHFGDLFWTTKAAYGNTMGEGTNILKLNAIC